MSTRKPDPRYRIPGTTVSLLSNPSKMPGYGFSLPAIKACPWRADNRTMARILAMMTPTAAAEYSQRLVCNHCYAQGGYYLMPTVIHALETRMAFVLASLRAKDGEFVRHMIRAIRKECLRRGGAYLWFRIHDDGDFFSPEYVRAWIEIVRACPDIHFWAPTKSYRGPAAMLAALRNLHAEPNMYLSLSAIEIDGTAPMIDGLGAAAEVVSDPALATCRAFDNHGHCGECRRCWAGGSSYHVHGWVNKSTAA